MPAPKAPEAPKNEVTETVPVNDAPVEKLHVIVDQDGVFLRVQVGETELEEDKDYELYEEEVEKEDEPTNENPGTPEKAEADDSDKCSECNGAGLKNNTTLCEACGGSGKAKTE